VYARPGGVQIDVLEVKPEGIRTALGAHLYTKQPIEVPQASLSNHSPTDDVPLVFSIILLFLVVVRRFAACWRRLFE
jgi:hypothetical protein